MLYRFIRAIARTLFMFYFRFEATGLEHFPREGGCIVVANHTSFLDPLLVCVAAPRVIHYITYAYFYYHAAIHWACKRTHCIPIKREGNDVSALKQALRLLHAGEIIGIFPEGARSQSGKLMAGEPGVALIALKAGAPIVPIGISGAYQAFPKGAHFPKPVKIRLTVGQPFRLDEQFGAGKKLTEETHQQAVRLIMSKIAAVCGEAVAPLPEAPDAQAVSMNAGSVDSGD